MSDQLAFVIGLSLLGYVLLLVELALIPGFTVAGVMGFVCLGAAGYLAVINFGAVAGSLIVAVLIATTTAVVVWFPRSRYGRGVIHRQSLATAKSTQSQVQVGDHGIAETDLRPAGIVRFGERRESAVSDGDYIAAGSEITVLLVEGGRIVVERKAEQEGSAASPDAPS